MSGLQHTRQEKTQVLEYFAESGQISAAFERAGLHRSLHYQWLQNDPVYKEEFGFAREKVGDMLEDVAVKRAKDSSDVLLIFLLKGAKPEKYRERYDSKVSGEVSLKHDVTDREALARRVDSIAERIRTEEILPAPDGPGMQAPTN